MNNEPVIVSDNEPIKAYLDLINGAITAGLIRGLPDLPGRLVRIEHVRRGSTLFIRTYPSDELLECIGRFIAARPWDKI